MKRDPEKDRAWRRRGAKKYQEKVRAQGRKPIPPENRKRKQKLQAVQFGAQAEWCRHHPCCFCYPELYTDELLALEHYSEKRICDPHHSPTVGAGGLDHDTVPACRSHHVQLDSLNHSEKSVERECGVRVRHVAGIIRRNLKGNIADE